MSDIMDMLQSATVVDANGDDVGHVSVITIAGGKLEITLDQFIEFDDGDGGPDGGEEVDLSSEVAETAKKIMENSERAFRVV